MLIRTRLTVMIAMALVVLVVGALMAASVFAGATTNPIGKAPAAVSLASPHVAPAAVDANSPNPNVAPLKFGHHTIVGSATAKDGTVISANSGNGDTSCPGTDPCP